MANCIVIVQFDLPKRTAERAIKGGTSSAPTYRNLLTRSGRSRRFPCVAAVRRTAVAGSPCRRRARSNRCGEGASPLSAAI